MDVSTLQLRREILQKVIQQMNVLPGDIYCFNSFLRCCFNGSFTNADGNAYFYNFRTGRTAPTSPAELVKGAQPPDWASHILWIPERTDEKTKQNNG